MVVTLQVLEQKISISLFFHFSEHKNKLCSGEAENSICLGLSKEQAWGLYAL